MPDTLYGLSLHVCMCLILQMSKLRLERLGTLSRISQAVVGSVSKFMTGPQTPLQLEV